MRQGNGVYELIEISKPDDFDALGRLLDEAYDPSSVAATLKAKVSKRCRALLVEHPYIDKDYRSTYYNFYAKKGYRYDASCTRLHFFEEPIELGPGLVLKSGRNLAENYFGYMVLRPTRIATIGRTVLSPALVDGFHGNVIDANHRVHLLGHRLSVKGFPYMSQHTDISVCAHVACWAILRHYSERYPQYAEFLTYDVTRMAHEFDPGGLLPSKGLQLEHAERIFAAAGTYPMVIAKRAPNDGLFYRQLLAYVESGFPLFAALNSHEHAVAIIGHGERIPSPTTTAPAHFAADLTRGLVVVDDNHLPYLAIERGQTNPYGVEHIDAFIVPLPEKVYYSAEAVDEIAGVLASGNVLGFDHSGIAPPVIRYFLTSASALRASMNELRSQFDPDLVRIVMELALPQFVWIVEISSPDQWKAGQVATRVVVDATASPYEDDPLFLMYDLGQAYVFERGGDHSHSVIKLNSPQGAVLSRMTGTSSSTDVPMRSHDREGTAARREEMPMKKHQPQKFAFAKDKVSHMDAGTLLRFKEAVRDGVVKPIRARASEQKAAIAKARTRYVR